MFCIRFNGQFVVTYKISNLKSASTVQRKYEECALQHSLVWGK